MLIFTSTWYNIYFLYSHIVATNLCPDIVLWSDMTKRVVLIELTVPWEEKIEEANERKRRKYQELEEDCKSKGWSTWCQPVEVGCRGFAGQSVWKTLGLAGVLGKARRDTIKDMCQAAEDGLRWIWHKREDQWKTE